MNLAPSSDFPDPDDPAPHLKAMHICTYNISVRFTWDDDKAEEVIAEHHVEFSKVIDIFEDPYAIEFVDERHSSDEEVRYAIIGLTGYGLTYLVYTEPSADELHFITTRLAEKWMEDDYEENKRR